MSSTAVNDTPTPDLEAAEDQKEQRPTLWRDDGWTARIIKNEEDDGWAVEMTMDGEAEPALVGPWTMGRDKKTPSRSTRPPSSPSSRRPRKSCAVTSSNCTQRCIKA